MVEKNGIVNLDLSKNSYCIYILRSGVEEDKNAYIGVTKDFVRRWKQHASSLNDIGYFVNPELYDWMRDIINNKKDKIYFSILEKDLDEKTAFEKEILYIKDYKLKNYNLLNKTEGGKGALGLSNRLRSKNISKSAKGLKRHIKPVFVKNLETNEILSYESGRVCATTMKVAIMTVSNRCSKKNLNPYHEKYIFSHDIQDLQNLNK